MKSFCLFFVTALLFILCCHIQRYNKSKNSYYYQKGIETYSTQNFLGDPEYLNKVFNHQSNISYIYPITSIIRLQNNKLEKVLTVVNLAQKKKFSFNHDNITMSHIASCYEEQGKWSQTIGYTSIDVVINLHKKTLEYFELEKVIGPIVSYKSHFLSRRINMKMLCKWK